MDELVYTDEQLDAMSQEELKVIQDRTNPERFKMIARAVIRAERYKKVHPKE